jgi:NAD/NADP transhydrogenase beta subunit
LSDEPELHGRGSLQQLVPLFIYGLMGLAGPKTAVRGNLIAAAGMAIAVAATLVKISDTDQWALIIAEPFTACRGG